MNKRATQYFPMFMLIMVMMAVPILYWRLSVKMDETKKLVSEDQLVLLAAPYDKEDTIAYLENSAKLAIPEILGATALANGHSAYSTCGTIQYNNRDCAIANNGAKICQPNMPESFTYYFNLYLDNYIKIFNDKSFTKLPVSNYDTHLEGNNINAIATLPAKKGLAIKGRELDTVGTIWFAPSFTINYEHKLEQYKNIFDTLTIILNKCYKHSNPKECVDEQSHLTGGWGIANEGDNYIFTIPIKIPAAELKVCYSLNLPATTPST